MTRPFHEQISAVLPLAEAIDGSPHSKRRRAQQGATTASLVEAVLSCPKCKFRDADPQVMHRHMAHELATSRRRRRTGQETAPVATADTTVSYTVRFDIQESLNVDRLALELKAQTGRRTLDKSEIIRVLLRLAGELAGEEPAVRAALLRELER